MSTGDRPKLTRLQQRFCEEYIKDLNATAAYSRAGYKGGPEVARRHASRLLTNVDIQNCISELQGRRSKRTQITADRVLKEIAAVAFANITDVVEWTPNSVTVKASDTLGKRTKRAIAEVSMKETVSEFATTREVKVKMHDKLRALAKLADHLGMNFSIDDMIRAVVAQGYAVSNPNITTDTSEADPLSEIESNDA